MWVTTIVTLCVISCTNKYVFPTPTEQNSWTNKVTVVIEYANACFAKNNIYPRILPEQYQAVLDALSVPGKYRVNSDLKGFMIQIGDYGRDGWSYNYSSGSRLWYIDR